MFPFLSFFFFFFQIKECCSSHQARWGHASFLFHFHSAAFLAGSLASSRMASGQRDKALLDPRGGCLRGLPCLLTLPRDSGQGKDSTSCCLLGSRQRAVGGSCTFPEFSVTPQEPLCIILQGGLQHYNEEVFTLLILVRPGRSIQ